MGYAQDALGQWYFKGKQRDVVIESNVEEISLHKVSPSWNMSQSDEGANET